MPNLQPCPSPQRPMEKQKKDDGGFYFCASLLVPPKYGGNGGFSFGFYSSSSIKDGTGSVSGENGANKKKEDATSALADDFSFSASVKTTPAIITSAALATAASRFYFRAVYSL